MSHSMGFGLYIKIFVLSIVLLSSRVAYPLDIELSWCPGSGDNLSGYRVFCRQDGEAFDYSKPVWEGSQTTSMIRGLDEGIVYFFIARAFDESVSESVDSNEVRYPVLESTTPADETAPEQFPDIDDTDKDGMPD